MRRFSLVNDAGLGFGPELSSPSEQFGHLVMSGKFKIKDDPSDDPQQICLCSHGSDECLHCGRESKP